MPEHTARRFPGGISPVAARAIAVPVLLILLSGGAWTFAAVVTSSFAVSSLLVLAWFGVVGIGTLAVSWRRPGLRTAVLGTHAVACAAALAGAYWTTIRDDAVNETVATGVAASEAASGGAPARGGARVNVIELEGRFASLAHDTSGTARVVRLAGGGQVLTLTEFETDNGPDLRVYLVPGRTRGDDVSDHVDLGGLKGNIGNQQYAIPAGIDVSRHRSVVVWFRAFSVAFGRAELAGA